MSESVIYKTLRNGGLNEIGTCAMMGNMYKESLLKSNNVEDSSGLSDEEYTKAVDDGRITGYQFASHARGFGLCQWTMVSRKQGLYNFAQSKRTSIADEVMQCEYCIKELKEDFASLYSYLQKCVNLSAAVERICNEFERPDKSVADIPTRYQAAKRYYDNRSHYEKEGENMNSVIEAATSFMENVAADDSNGYSQKNRWGNGGYDCSSLVITAWEQAGVPVKAHGATYTGNMLQAFINSGFKDVTSSTNPVNGYGLERGDVLLNEARHTAQYVGNGKMVHARSDDGHPEAGDQTGREICIANYYNYPWDYVLRYSYTTSESANSFFTISTDINLTGNNKYYPSILKKGDKGAEVLSLQKELNEIGFTCGEPDGDFGKLTLTGVTNFQKAYNLTPVDGEAGPITLAKLVEQYKIKTGKTSAFANQTGEVVKEQIKVGDVVMFTGTKQFFGANFSLFNMKAQKGTAKVTAVQEGAKHPYHLASEKDMSADVYGWCNSEDVRKI